MTKEYKALDKKIRFITENMEEFMTLMQMHIDKAKEYKHEIKMSKRIIKALTKKLKAMEG